MPRLMRYDSAATIPSHLQTQICTLLRAEWPDPDETDAAAPLLAPELHPTYFVLADEGLVLSYARTIWAQVSHLGQSFKLYGLGDVMTRPEFRRKGYGGRVVGEATTYIKSDRGADTAVLLLATQKLVGLYRPSGWGYVPGLRVATGEGDSVGASIPMLLFLSAKARAARVIFPEELLVLPGDEW